MKIVLSTMLLMTTSVATSSEETSRVSQLAVVASDFSLEAEDFAAIVGDESSYRRSQIPAQRLAEAAGKFRKDLFELSGADVEITAERCQLLRATIDRLKHRYRLLRDSFASDHKLWRKERLTWADENLAISYKRLMTLAGDFVNRGCQ